MHSIERHSIAGIVVEGLFGLYGYQLGLSVGQAFDPGLLLFYGDNGRGKTTILRLLYHTLSPELQGGHRTALTRIPVRRFCITLGDGTEIEIRRGGDSLVGPYKWLLTRPNQTQLFVDVVPNEQGNVTRSQDPEVAKKWAALESELIKLGLSVYFLPDDRKSNPGKQVDSGIDLDLITYDNAHTISYEQAKKAGASQRSALELTVYELVNFLRGQVISASQIGEANINQIYAGIVRRLIWNKGEKSGEAKDSGDILVALSSLMERSEPFSDLGLMPRLDFRDLQAQIGQGEPSTKTLIAGVLQPYVDSISARLDALASVQEVIETFLKLLGEFYTDKYATFDTRSGLQIKQREGKELPLQFLSSGEKQLLLLFCNTIRARARAAIFIIDEPELSLNVKWQRRLIESLLSLVKGSGVQFVIATHSIELLAGQREAIVRLNPKSLKEFPDTWNDEPSPS